MPCRETFAKLCLAKWLRAVVLSDPSKLVAYELGFSESSVSELLGAALRKLNLRPRAKLIELYGGVLG